jgi:LysM domain
MSAMHAMALPDHDPDRRSAVICRFHGRAVRSRPVRAQAPDSTTARAQAPDSMTARAQAPASETARAQAASTGTADGRAVSTATARARAASTRPARAPEPSARMARGQAVRPRAATAPLRLTRRGRVVIAVAVAIVVTAVSLIASGVAQATSHAVPPGAAGQHLSRVVVRPGQSLWSVAAGADPGADTRLVVQQIIELNGLTSGAVPAGQQLWVPRG